LGHGRGAQDELVMEFVGFMEWAPALSWPIYFTKTLTEVKGI
jgi:hypothetical protein